jgi:hypothetical protein
MRRILPLLLLAAPSARADEARAPVELSVGDTLLDASFAGEWTPSGAAIEVRADVYGSVSTEASFRGEVAADWDRGLLSASGGDSEIALAASTLVAFAVRWQLAGSSGEANFDAVSVDGFASVPFDGFLLPGQPDAPAHVAFVGEPFPVAQLSAQSGAAAVSLALRGRWLLRADLQGTALSVGDMRIDAWDESVPLLADRDQGLATTVLASARLDALGTLILIPEVTVDLGGASYALAGIEVPIQLELDSPQWTLGPTPIEFPASPDDDPGTIGSPGDPGPNRSHAPGCGGGAALTLLLPLPLRRRTAPAH